MYQPFRWDVKRREQLGKLLEGTPAEAYPEFWEDLRLCAARVLSASQDGNLVFLGRSPESLFDYLSGMLGETSWASRLALLNVSLHRWDARDIRREYRQSLEVFRQHLAALELSPRQIAAAPRKTVLVDVVSGGSTYQNLSELWLEWARGSGLDPAALARRMRFVGLVWRTKNSPNTWRWQQHAPWLAAYGPRAAHNVSIPGRMWRFIGEEQHKVSRWNPPPAWGLEQMAEPPREFWHLEALRFAYAVYSRAREPLEREAFRDLLTQQPSMRHGWFRDLLGQIR
ncbi:MAG: hypothetical protein SFU83_05150 [Meiothermus sp.]|nr:hypothetical protein [Meiothermus sp.]